MPSTIASAASEYQDTLPLPEAKQHLKISTNDYDEEVVRSIRSAVDWCERNTGRTLRLAVSRVDRFNRWNDLLKPFNWQPVIAVSAIKYYDVNGTAQTLGAGNYRFIASTDSAPIFEFDDNASLPEIAVRSDAVSREYTTGYANISDIPPSAIQAIKLMLTVFWGDLSPQEMMRWEQAAKDMLTSIDTGGYR